MYLNKLLIFQKLQQTNAHIGATAKNQNFQKSRFSAYRRFAPFLLGIRTPSVPILNLDQTLICLRRSFHIIEQIARSNGHFLFVNTNPRYNKIVQQTAKKSRQSYINYKWIGGFLTNWNQMQNVQERFQQTKQFSGKYEISDSIQKQRKSLMLFPLQQQAVKQNILLDYSEKANHSANKEIQDGFEKNEKAVFHARSDEKEFNHTQSNLKVLHTKVPRFQKMQKCFEGTIDSYKKRPDCLIVLNAIQNATAIYEAHLSQIPVVALVDANIPRDLYKLITYPIPANYESAPFIYLFCNCLLKTILHSQKKF